MKYRVILLVHHSSLIRKLLKGYILSELSDVKIVEAKYKHEVEQILDYQSIDIILSGNMMKEFNSSFVFHAKNSSKLNQNTPVVILTSSHTDSNIEELKKSGIQHYIFPPHSSPELISKINKLYDPRKLRSEPRYFIPGASALIHMENSDLQTKVINISQKAVRCELKFNENNDTILKANYISLQFPEEYNNIIIKDIWSKILNIKVLNWNNDLTVKTFQAIWLFEDFGHNKAQFVEVFEKIENKINTSPN